ncbi:hypothetical protein [Mesorhizobium sp. B1-1-8]|uniref:hypothetical protein n=1 Tax=Mesorhizobium sp. B1-1-8 TaxID=2589976 RepID=UPI00112DD4E6|nr:hypothetical protein [Mesorhizobium sp. B1-1-8]UCI06302.1 hypothetical protein FJ974_21140 [Mesorhizobium sp. B1-1-8]
MVRRNKPKQLSGADLEQFLKAAEALHASITRSLISPQCEHYRSMQMVHAALLKSVREITGTDAPFIRWNGTGPAR